MKTNINDNLISGNYHLKVSFLPHDTFLPHNIKEEIVYRTIVLGGNNTFKDLSDIIQNNFGFDKGHLDAKLQYSFAFYMTTIVYGISRGELNENWFEADEIKIGAFNLIEEGEIEYMLTYWGDDFFFKIETLSIKTDEEELEDVKIIESIGENPDIDGTSEWMEEEEFE